MGGSAIKITAAILLALMTIAGPAQAYIVSKEVGPILQKVQALIADKNYGAATAKLNEAEAVKVTADDEIVINQFKRVIEVASSDAPAQTPQITPQLPQP